MEGIIHSMDEVGNPAFGFILGKGRQGFVAEETAAEEVAFRGPKIEPVQNLPKLFGRVVALHCQDLKTLGTGRHPAAAGEKDPSLRPGRSGRFLQVSSSPVEDIETQYSKFPGQLSQGSVGDEFHPAYIILS